MGAVDMQGSKAGATSKEASIATLVRPTMEMKYRSLHHHSTFSYKDGFALPSSHVHRAAELGMPALALTEHGNVSSHAKLWKAANEYGIKPIFGCELYTGAVGDDRTQRKNHLTVLAADAVGYRHLLRIVSQGWSDFYYEPTVSGQVLADMRQGLVILSGCTGSLLATSLVGGKNVAVEDASYARGKEVARRFKKTFGDAYYLEVQMFPELENVRRINQMLEQIGKELKIPLVATGDCHYTKPEESELQQILHSVGRNKTLEQLAQGWGYDVPLSPPLTDFEVFQRLVGTGLSNEAAFEAIQSTVDISDRCNVTMPSMDPVRFPVPDGYSSSEEVWLKWLRRGWDYRRMDEMKHLRDNEGRTPAQRVKYEMDLIETKGFIDYFLICADIVTWAKDHGILVGPARGSAAASLVCYLLRITEVNPLLFSNLLFERFIDISRPDPPDIDLDFDDERRHEVFEYAAQRFGRDHVGRIGTFTYFRSKNSLDDVAMVHRIPKGAVEKVKEVLVERSSGDLRASATIEDTAENFEQAREVFEKYPQLWKATELEGNVKDMGVHAAGLVVASRPITDVCAVYVRTDDKGRIEEDEFGNPREVISFDKYDCEAFDMLKMDFLGLSNMGLLKWAMTFTGLTLEDVYALPLDDPDTLQGFAENDCIGIFQFDGWAMRSVNANLKASSFDEIADVNALARPGPLHSNASGEYVEVKRGNQKPTISHPLLDEITAPTHGQIVYQEQILRIVRDIGKFDWTHSAKIRKIISKKVGEQEFNRSFSQFQEGARSQGMDDETIKAVWGACITAGAYAFNAAHSVSYGMIAYWTMWFKRNHTAAFYAAALRKLGKDPDKRLSLLRDAWRHDIEIKPPHPNKSGITWEPEGKTAIRAGFAQLPRLGEKMGDKIVGWRKERGDFKKWSDLIAIPGIGDKTVAAAKEFVRKDDPFEVHKLRRSIDAVKEAIRNGELGEVPYPTHRVEDIPGDRGPDVEVVWLGQVHSRNLRDLFEVNFGKTGEALDLDTVKRPDLPEWLIMYCEDDTDQISVTIDRFRYPKFRNRAWKIELDHDLILVRGVKKGYQSRRALYVWDMWVIDPDG